MEPIEQINQDFDVKKPKKKGLIVGGIVAAVIVVALVLVYFLVFTNPKFIFSKAIDKIFTVDTTTYDSIKLDTKIKATVETEDVTMQDQLAEIEKFTVKLGTQMDLETKKEIVDLGLEYDNQAVIDARLYYNDGEMYAYLEELFDKYIELDMDEETKTQMDEIFNAASSDELKNAEKTTKIVRDEIKAQINEKGEFEKTKTTIDVGDDEEKVTKTTLTLSQKELYSVISSMCLNLADNEEFLDYFGEAELAESLEELAEEINDEETNSKNNMKISIYTKGLLPELVAVDVAIYSAEEKQTIIVTFVKETEDVYAYNVCVKMPGAKVDAINGKVEIQKEKENKNEQVGKIIITAEVIQTGSAKVEIDYSAEYNKGIDKIDTSNSINMNNLTEEDMNSIMTKLMKRPLIGELIEQQISLFEQAEDAAEKMEEAQKKEKEMLQEIENLAEELNEKENNFSTTQNEVKGEYYGYSVTYSVPNGFEYDSEFSQNHNKDYSTLDIDANVSLGGYTEAEYIKEINLRYEHYLKETKYYRNVNLSKTKTVTVGDKNFKYVLLSYETSYDTNGTIYYAKEQEAYVWYALDEENIFKIKLKSYDKDITEDIIKGFLNINVTKLN